MAPKSKLARRRRSARLQVDEPMLVASPDPQSVGSPDPQSVDLPDLQPVVLPDPQPVTSPVSLAIVLYKAPTSSSSEKSPMAASEATAPPIDLKKSVETDTTSPVKVKSPPNKKKPIPKGKGRKSVVWRKVPEARRNPGPSSPPPLTRQTSKVAVSSPASSSPESRPPPSKRQKASPSSKQVSVSKTLHLNNLLELVRVPQIVQERCFLIDELGGLFKQAVLRQGWDEMLARMASVRLNLTLVREFYASLALALGPSRKAESLDSKAVSIRGKTILFSPSTISYALGVSAASTEDREGLDSALKLMTKEHVVECCYMHPPSQLPGELSCGQLHVSHRALGHLVRALLYPTTQTSQLPLAEAKLICLLATENRKLPVEFFLYESIKKTAISIAKGQVGCRTTLFHPAVISIVCQQQDIETYDQDESGELVKLSMSSVIRGNAQSINFGPNLDIEAALNVAKKTAAMLEDKADHRISALERAVNGLRKDIVCLHRMVGSLHDAFVAAKLISPSAEVNEAEDAFDSPAT